MLSAQHDRRNVYNLLLKTYGADPNLRDYSGHKAEHYLVNEDFIGLESSDLDAVDAGSTGTLIQILQKCSKTLLF